MTIYLSKKDICNIYLMFDYFAKDTQMSNELRKKLVEEFKLTLELILAKIENKNK